ncbi:hypothetical protein, partial [Klebsiella pneumoniae]|uniref:hypothetical protein n=1 Tax=Klebsiella pneumoniae TaxID=573 RepID=UPI0025A0E9A7
MADHRLTDAYRAFNPIAPGATEGEISKHLSWTSKIDGVREPCAMRLDHLLAPTAWIAKDPGQQGLTKCEFSATTYNS